MPSSCARRAVYKQIDRMPAPLAANLPPALRQQLLDNGLDLKVRQRVVPLFFENNNELAPMIVPVNDAVITPVSRELF